MTPQFIAKDAAEWRGWLAKNHDKASEVWLVFYKQHTGQTCPTYNEAVEEALCYGWVDGMKRSLGHDTYAFRFTPRKPNSNWSPSNVRRARQMIRDGRMQPAGMRLVEAAQKSGAFDNPHRPPVFEMPGDFAALLKKHKRAGAFFETLPPSHKKQYIAWIASAKRTETRQKRLKTALQMLEAKQRLGMV